MSTFPQTIDALDTFATRAGAATLKGASAYVTLLHLAKQSDTGQASRVARFLAATYNGLAVPLDPFELRMVDVAISDDLLACLDALRWGRVDLHKLVSFGDARMGAVLKRWGLWGHASVVHVDGPRFGRSHQPDAAS